MTDEPTATTATAAQDADAANSPDAVLGLVTDGAHTLIVAQFPTRADVDAAYSTLQEIERTSSLKIDSVLQLGGCHQRIRFCRDRNRTGHLGDRNCRSAGVLLRLDRGGAAADHREDRANEPALF